MDVRLTKLEAIIPTLATKADLGDLRADIERGQKDNRTWMLATSIGLFVGILAAGNFVASGMRQSTTAAAMPPPLVIQVPAPSAAPRPAGR